ncbi:MAG: histidinol-phosphate transaminase [Betaproteobacteria bacterium]|jgi:histidinol-phosphate aminotransferase|nr:histidinol-phosphate transaminase [Betaproteobacteria bacterium]MDH4293369.1 histidinol-phosphate transaminase [Betaproteobacteria bacterium]MDH5341670.1 histidinol-phosphate transaminase [Betaproteobacteria bacterium]
MSFCDLAPDYVRAIAPYQPGKPTSELARELGLEESGIVKLASNENPLGVSPKAAQAMRAVFDGLARYPDGNGFELKRALSRRFGVPMDGIVLGNGSNDVLELAARSFLAPGLSAVYSRHAFAVYPLVVQAIGAQGIVVPAREFGHDLGAMARAVRPDTRIVFVANPNNPTGTFIAGPELETFIAGIPQHVLVVLDEAYNEYLEPQYRYDGIGWLKKYPNLMITRTFSKVYGLAGLRVGYALAAPGVADLMNRVRQPFNVNSLSLAAAAAALDDDAFMRESYQLNRRGMAQLVAGLDQQGLEHIPSYGNFVTFKVPGAAEIFRKLLHAGVIVRPIASYDMPDHLRVSVGLESENARFLGALRQALA